MKSPICWRMALLSRTFFKPSTETPETGAPVAASSSAPAASV